MGSDFSLSLIERCLIAGRAIIFYLGKLLWPLNLIFIYPKWTVSARVWWQYLYPTAVIALMVSAWLVRGRAAPWRRCCFSPVHFFQRWDSSTFTRSFILL